MTQLSALSLFAPADMKTFTISSATVVCLLVLVRPCQYQGPHYLRVTVYYGPKQTSRTIIIGHVLVLVRSRRHEDPHNLRVTLAGGCIRRCHSMKRRGIHVPQLASFGVVLGDVEETFRSVLSVHKRVQDLA